MEADLWTATTKFCNLLNLSRATRHFVWTLRVSDAIFVAFHQLHSQPLSTLVLPGEMWSSACLILFVFSFHLLQWLFFIYQYTIILLWIIIEYMYVYIYIYSYKYASIYMYICVWIYTLYGYLCKPLGFLFWIHTLFLLMHVSFFLTSLPFKQWQ